MALVGALLLEGVGFMLGTPDGLELGMPELAAVGLALVAVGDKLACVGVG